MDQVTGCGFTLELITSHQPMERPIRGQRQGMKEGGDKQMHREDPKNRNGGNRKETKRKGKEKRNEEKDKEQSHEEGQRGKC